MLNFGGVTSVDIQVETPCPSIYNDRLSRTLMSEPLPPWKTKLTGLEPSFNRWVFAWLIGFCMLPFGPPKRYHWKMGFNKNDPEKI